MVELGIPRTLGPGDRLSIRESLSERVTTSSNQRQMRWKRLLKQLASPTHREIMPSTGGEACATVPSVEKGHH